MADFNKLKDTIRGAIYPNGRGAISADKHQAALLEMADTMQETDSKVTELSAENERLKERIEEQDIFIADLQDMKIDRENDDYYPKMAVGLADNLAGVDVVDSEINFRRSGGGAISDGVARIESIKGNSVVWNQWINSSANSATKTENGVTFTKNEDGSFSVVTDSAGATANTYIRIGSGISVINTHKYILYGAAQGGRYETYNAYATSGFASSIYDYGAGAFGTSIGGYTYVVIMVKSGQVISSPLKFSMKLIDLTQMFGAGNEPTTIEEFYQRIPQNIDINAYNEGEVIHMDVQSIESQGVNAWDEQWEIGIYDSDNGKKMNGGAYDNQIRSKEPFAIIPNTEYYFNIPNKASGSYMAFAIFLDKNKNYISKNTIGPSAYQKVKTPSNACYMVFTIRAEYGTTYNNDICINISDASVNGKYFPHIKRVEDLAVIRKYFPNGMRSAGTAHDEIRYNKASGKWEKVQRIGEVNLGSLEWSYSGQERFNAFGVSDFAPIQNDDTKANLLCAKYDTKSFSEIFAHIADKTIGMHSSGQVVIYDSAYNEAAFFKASLQGVILYYELAEPIVTELDEADQYKDLDYQVWNAGTEKAIAEGKSAPLAADITYGFNAIGKIKELESLVAALRAKVGI